MDFELKKGHVFGVILVVMLLFTFLFSHTVIPTGHTGVLTTFGKVENTTLDAGFHMKAPWQKVIKMDNRIQKQSTDLECFSKDIQEVQMTFTLNYQISKENAMTIYKTIGKSYYETVIIPMVSESVKTVTAKYTAEELITDRSKLAVGIEELLSENLKTHNIILVSTAIENIDFTDAFTDAVEAKQVAQQNKLRVQTETETKIIEANADAEVKQIEADAEAYVNETISESLTSEILEKMYYEKWNGELPKVVGSDSNIIMNMKDGE